MNSNRMCLTKRKNKDIKDLCQKNLLWLYYFISYILQFIIYRILKGKRSSSISPENVTDVYTILKNKIKLRLYLFWPFLLLLFHVEIE